MKYEKKTKKLTHNQKKKAIEVLTDGSGNLQIDFKE